MALGFGIVGCGMISQFHAKALADVAGAKLVACVDRRLDAAKAFGEQHGINAYDDLDTMLADPKVDVVTIGTPSGAHMEPAVAAANAGKHVIVEKPLEITGARTDPAVRIFSVTRLSVPTNRQPATLHWLAHDQQRLQRVLADHANSHWRSWRSSVIRNQGLR